MSSFVEIRAERFDLVSNLRELWRHRELLYFLIWRDLKVRYKQTLIGFGWVLIQPLMITLIFSLILSRYAQDFLEKVPYWLFAFSGFSFWSSVSTAINLSANCFIQHKELVTKVYFPRILMPLASVLSTALDLLITLIILLIAVISFKGLPSWKILLLPICIALIILFTISIGLLLSALNVLYRDVKHALPFLLQLMMFITPVFYSVNFLPEKWRILWYLNPLTGSFETIRSSLFDLEINFTALIFSIILTIITFITSLYVFSKLEDSFADII